MNTPGLPAEEPGPRIGAGDTGAALLDDSMLGPPWWAPAPELVPPDEGTFRFLYRVTGHDADGSPTIAATVTFVLRFPSPPAEEPDARPVGRTGTAVRLRVPFVDADTGAPMATELPMEATERDGAVHCRAEISGALARAAYGALSTPGFQPHDGAALVVDTGFVAVQEVAIAWAAAAEVAVQDGGTAGEPGVPDLTVVVPVREWPWEDPPRPERMEPEEHPEWGELVSSRVVLPDVAELAAELPPVEVSRSLFAAEAITPVDDVIAIDELPVDLSGGLDPDGFSPQPGSTTIDMAVSVTRQHRLPLLVPCRDHPRLYRHDPGDGAEPEVVGCQEAVQLGRIPARRFAHAPGFDREHRYAVWESLQQPATYLVVPEHYRVARGVTGRPHLEWLQVFDAGVDAGLPCLLQARCVPDLTPAELAELESRLRPRAGGRDVRILLPTSPSVGATGVSVLSSTLEGGLRAVLDDDAVRLALRVDYADAVVAVTQLRGGEAVAGIAVETGDPRLTLGTTVHLDVDDLAGPYPGGPVRVAATGLRNDADTPATVTALWARSAALGWERTPLDPPVRLPPHGEVPLAGSALPVPVRDGTAVAEARLDPAEAAQLAVRNVYLENLHTSVLIRRDVDLRAAGVAAVGLAFAVSGIEVARAVLPAAVPTLEVTLVQPLVADVSAFDRKVAVSATLTREDGTAGPAGTPVIVDLSAGAIVRLSSLIGP